MLIANSKIKENIAEYILYMWQLESNVRTLNFDLKLIEQHIVTKMTSNEDAQNDVLDWYQELINEMKNDDLIEKGHLRRVHEVVDEVFFLHNTLLTSLKDEKYKDIFTNSYSFISELRSKSDKDLNDVEVCLTGLYGKLLLKMQRKEISKETDLAFESFSKVLSYLSVKYKDFKTGKLKFQVNN